MITIVCSSQYPLDNFKKEIIKSCGLGDKVEFLGYENKGEFSLTEIYNRGLKEAKYDIICFLHHDLTIDSKQWGKKLLKHFYKNPEYGIIAVAGTSQLIDGCWWSNKSKMKGIVKHTHEGKSWLSKYSSHLGSDIEEVVVVDGVFFGVHKKRIKNGFNEEFKGFHFYDVSFSFENYLAGVKNGVCYDILVNHQSIGQTNEKWLDNKILFEKLYGNNLPVNIKKVLRKGQRLKVLIGCLSFNNYTGSELYVFELAKGLIKEGCDVSICSNIGNPLDSVAKKLGVKTYTLQEPPGFKLGDGKWKLKTNQGEVDSQLNTLYKINDINFDVIHLNHKPVTEHLLRLYPGTPVVCSIHSEVISLEEPVISTQIKKYIAIRPEIKEYIVDRFEINPNDVDVIYNPIDSDKFKPTINNQKRDKKRILFCGTIDYLRKNTIQDLINTTKNDNQELWIVGKKNDTYLDDMILGQDHVKYFPPSAKIEEYIHQSDTVAGILLGRTTIEGWMCGKSAIIYNVDNTGNIISKKLHDIPSDIDKFKTENVLNQIIKEYKSILE